jgi:hypothetical protein
MQGWCSQCRRRQSGVSLAQSGRLVPALIGVRVTIPYRHVQSHASVPYYWVGTAELHLLGVMRCWEHMAHQLASLEAVIFIVKNMVQSGHPQTKDQVL